MSRLGFWAALAAGGLAAVVTGAKIAVQKRQSDKLYRLQKRQQNIDNLMNLQIHSQAMAQAELALEATKAKVESMGRVRAAEEKAVVAAFEQEEQRIKGGKAPTITLPGVAPVSPIKALGLEPWMLLVGLGILVLGR